MFGVFACLFICIFHGCGLGANYCDTKGAPFFSDELVMRVGLCFCSFGSVRSFTLSGNGACVSETEGTHFGAAMPSMFMCSRKHGFAMLIICSIFRCGSY